MNSLQSRLNSFGINVTIRDVKGMIRHHRRKDTHQDLSSFHHHLLQPDATISMYMMLLSTLTLSVLTLVTSLLPP